jgi:GNAT superfamily N-acetyltransferase
MTHSIRLAKLSDLEVCVAFDCTDTTSSRNDEIKSNHILAKIDSNEIYVAVTEKDNPIGYLTFDHLWPMMLPLLSWLYVAPAWRDQGISRDLMNYAIQDLKDRGYKRVMLSTQTDRPKMIEMIEKFGVRVIGTLQANPDESVGEVFYIKDLA